MLCLYTIHLVKEVNKILKSWFSKTAFVTPNDPRSLNLPKIISLIWYLYFIYRDNCRN